ncbi:GGDEF domain-containing protein [Shewanella colwelliana]|uniref:GGDEF domain-containing protein n=1 Tax=Shewanella colwelliana TaxID=23 RepID=UPI003736E5F4
MLVPKIPKDESTRLATLNALQVLDTSPEERFDRVTRLARRLFGVNIALVSLVDENRQWFKSAMGLDAKETPRDISFCGHAILGDELFYIQDTLLDERFADNPLVTRAPHIRFYAGQPLRAANGQKIGTLCIIHDEPKTLTHEDMETLVDLSSMVEHELAAISLATLDELTGITNRRGFCILADKALTMSRRRGLCSSLVFIDLDSFKPINDQYGHQVGDEALRLFSQQMVDTFRDSDILGRVGGDEFIVLLSDSTMRSAIEAIDRFNLDLNKSLQREKAPYQLNFSYGVMEIPADSDIALDIAIEEADQRMYLQKYGKKVNHNSSRTKGQPGLD